jgi:outer membrane protein assembly factor BamB
MKRLIAGVITVCCLAALTPAADWPSFRGPTGQGTTAETGLPVTWSPKDNVKWKVALPDSGTSTPIVWGEKIFLTQSSDKDWPPGQGALAAARRRSLLCLNRADGKLLWQQDVAYAEKEATHIDNPFCSASPATDGERVVVSHGSAGMYCYDFNGKELWKYDVGKLRHQWGNASSPILHDNLAILWCGPGLRRFLVAVDKKTGQEVWKVEEAKGKGGDGFYGMWSTPLLARVNGQDQLLVSFPHQFKGLDPKTGKELWSCDGLTALVYTSPLYHDGVAVAMSGYGGAALAVQLGGQGDITKDRLWHHPRNTQRIGSGVILGDHIYMVEHSGQPHCYELKTGQEIWGKQVDKRPVGGTYSSMVAGDGKLYVSDRTGNTVVLAASPKYQLLAVNRLGENTDASIAIANGELLIRTWKHLWCISEKK